MKHEKKLSDFLIDRKIPKCERDSIPLLVLAGTIAWIAGVELSDDFKLGAGNGVRVEVVAERLREE